MPAPEPSIAAFPTTEPTAIGAVDVPSGEPITSLYMSGPTFCPTALLAAKLPRPPPIAAPTTAPEFETPPML